MSALDRTGQVWQHMHGRVFLVIAPAAPVDRWAEMGVEDGPRWSDEPLHPAVELGATDTRGSGAFYHSEGSFDGRYYTRLL